MDELSNLISEIKKCRYCEKHLPYTPNPVFTASVNSKIVIIGQAPGAAVHKSGIPWDDSSGINLRKWLNVDVPMFYNPDFFSLMPMGFCYPGKSSSGDLPPRPECSVLWHKKLLVEMNKPELILLIGRYAQKYYLKQHIKTTLTQTVKNFQNYLPQYFPLPHPSPRNNIWMAKNRWFQESVLPVLKQKVNEILQPLI